MKVVNILWSITDEELVEAIEEEGFKKIARILGITIKKNLKLTKEEKLDIALSKIRHQLFLAQKIVGLPDEVELPQELISEEDDAIAEWLSNKYGYCHEGFLFEDEV